jgi:hypothetical protein
VGCNVSDEHVPNVFGCPGIQLLALQVGTENEGECQSNRHVQQFRLPRNVGSLVERCELCGWPVLPRLLERSCLIESMAACAVCLCGFIPLRLLPYA